MATVNKNFRIKNGLIVEGTTATVNGEDILTKSSADQTYIINLIGGTATPDNTIDTVVKRDGNGNFAAGDITVNEISIGSIGRIYDDGDLIIQATEDGDDVVVNADDVRLNAQDDVWITAGVDGSVDGDVILHTNGGEIRLESNDVYVGFNTNNEDRVATQGYVDTAIGNIDLTYTTDDVTEGSNLYFTDHRAETAISNALGESLQYASEGAGNVFGINPTYLANEITDGARSAVSVEQGGSPLTYDSSTGVIGIGIATSGGINLDGSNDLKVNRDVVDEWYDAAGAASAAEAAANVYTDNEIGALNTDNIPEIAGATNKYFTDERARGAFTPGSGLEWTGINQDFLQIDTDYVATTSYVDSAINNLVDGAPGLLDTLNEIAAAINDDANYFTTVTNAINAKQDALTAGANIDITNDTISVTGLDTDDVAEGTNLYFTDARARDAVDGTDRSFTSVAINEVSKEVAATTGNIATAAATTAYSWLKTDYRSAKFMVKIKNGTHTEVSEILVTLDTSDNVYVTEYGMSSTSGTSLGTISADVSSNDVRIRVTPANDNSEVIVAGTLLI